MPVRYIDLTLEIAPGIPWSQFPRKTVSGAEEPPTLIETLMDNREKHGGFTQKIQMTTQGFTNIDAPRHFYKEGTAIDEIPLEQLIGEAVVIDMTHKQPQEAITAEDLESTQVTIQKDNMVIIRTGWTDRTWGTQEFWSKTMYIREDACDWLINKRIKALVSDFYPDIPPFTECKSCRKLMPIKGTGSPNHRKFLKEGIILVEYCTNLLAIQQPKVTLICLPLKIRGADGSPARVIALEEY